ncbi:acyl-CoA thioesterase [Oceanobacillus bengalensis]|uniref:acyl-CoA thioesterase n=1 Tax=Oceanobacillus bengalensis TaxID=1435466 RepID=UPI001FE504D1|nr:thioesterase family protein [Oceanobacillus bengalensis]
MIPNHETQVYVRFGETDAAGHVNNTSHFLYFEEGRTKFFKEFFSKRDTSTGFILAAIKCDYINQAYAGQILKVVSSVIKVGYKSFTIEQKLINTVNGQTTAIAEAVSVFFDYTEQKTIPIPEDYKEILLSLKIAKSS